MEDPARVSSLQPLPKVTPVLHCPLSVQQGQWRHRVSCQHGCHFLTKNTQSCSSASQQLLQVRLGEFPRESVLMVKANDCGHILPSQMGKSGRVTGCSSAQEEKGHLGGVLGRLPAPGEGHPTLHCSLLLSQLAGSQLRSLDLCQQERARRGSAGSHRGKVPDRLHLLSFND